MSNKFPELERPLNANERYLYAICARLDALVHMMSSFMEFYANQKNIATSDNKVVQINAVDDKIEVKEKPVKRTRRKKKEEV